jgi:hypothetical protein
MDTSPKHILQSLEGDAKRLNSLLIEHGVSEDEIVREVRARRKRKHLQPDDDPDDLRKPR